MKCGNCKGEHDSVAAVRACYNLPVETDNKPWAVDASGSAEPASPVDPFDELVLTGAELIKEHGVNVPRTPVPDEFRQQEDHPLDDPFAFKVGTQVPDWGTYTVVIPGKEWTDSSGETHKNEDTRRTFMFQVAEKGGLMGKVIIKYLNGPDNTRNYAGFANATADRRGVRVWKKYRDSYQLIQLLKFLLKTDDVLLDGREAYALQSSRCSMCRKKLTVPASINRGLGPDCAKKVV
jgi:hypothetical protein